MLSEDKATLLIKQAEDEAYVARQAAKDANAKADDAAKTASAAASAASPPGTKHVTYVPEIVKREIREELKKEVLATAQKDNWASPGAYPEWASRIRFYGDFRARYEGIGYPQGNADGGNFPNFNTINTGSPYDLSKTNPNLFPNYNTNQDRDRFRLRVRLGMEADLSDGFTTGLRIGTGDSSSPVSQNQTLGGLRRRLQQIRAVARSRLDQIPAVGRARRQRRPLRQSNSSLRSIWSGTRTSVSTAPRCRQNTRSSPASRPSSLPARSRSSTPI